MADILVVDDDQSIVAAFRRFLADERHQARFAGDAQDALSLIGEKKPDLVIMDVRMPGVDGLQALQEMRSRHPDLFVVIMTAYGTSQTSIEAIRSGAFEYLKKPLDLEELRAVIDKALAAQQISRGAEPQVVAGERSIDLVGETPAMLDIYRVIGRLATNDVPALITGERGTGKELVAETIHANSTRREGPFVSIDFRSASEDTVGDAFAEWGGTILLSKVDMLSAQVQGFLKRAMRDSQGRNAPTSGKMLPRVLASTDVDLREGIKQGTFDPELYDTLSVITITIPPLRDRRDDIPLLVAHLIRRFNGELNRHIKGIDAQVAEKFREHSWPGNVRELEVVLKRACILARADVITVDDLGSGLGVESATQSQSDATVKGVITHALHERLQQQGDKHGSPFHDLVDLVETVLVDEALKITKGNQVKAAEILRVNRATLRKKMLQ
jgi:DNA-binding NtrC family response regulator